MKKEIQLFLTALCFFTRIPLGQNLDYSTEKLTQSSRYFSLVGIVVGGLGALIFYISNWFFSDNISVLLSMIFTIWLTGAFHEDGFVDVCDGFGGGWTKEKILSIMKDSRVGAYGLIGMILILALKHQTLVDMDMEVCFYAIISGHAISRFSATLLMYLQPYVQETAKSKVHINHKLKLVELLVCGVFALLPLLLFSSVIVLTTFIVVMIFTYLLGKYFNKWIGGYTGDCAGAVQQITEVVFYLTLLIVL